MDINEAQQKVLKLVRLATSAPDSEEGRTAAAKACRLIAEHGLLIMKPSDLVQMSSTGTPGATFAAPSSIWNVIGRGIEWPAYFIMLGSVVAIALIVEHFATIRAITIAPPPLVKKARDLIEKRMFRECLDAMKRSMVSALS